jgi:hypothetical protein
MTNIYCFGINDHHSESHIFYFSDILKKLESIESIKFNLKIIMASHLALIKF